MATSPDTFFDNAQLRANNLISAANSASVDLQTEVETITSVLVDPSSGLLTLDITDGFPTFSTSADDTAPTPTFVPPTIIPPTGANLQLPDFTGVEAIEFPSDVPEVSTEGLFDFELPSTAIAEFTATKPDMEIKQLIDEMATITRPLMTTLEFPTLSELNIIDISLEKPEFLGDLNLDELTIPDEYDVKFKSNYAESVEVSTAAVNERVNGWILEQSPSFFTMRDSLEATLVSAMSESFLAKPYRTEFEVLQFERARARAVKASQQATLSIINTFNRSGFTSPPGAMAAALNAVNVGLAENTATAATEIYVQTRAQDIERYKWVIDTVNTQINALRSLALQYGQLELSVLQYAASYATAFVGNLIQVYDHKLRRSSGRVEVLNAFNQKFSNDISISQQQLDAKKLELEQNRLGFEIEAADVDRTSKQIQYLEAQVSNYAGLIDAISKKASLEELKIKIFETEKEVYLGHLQAQEASFNVYGAAMSGDEKKLEGELAKLKAFEGKLGAATARLEAQRVKLSAAQDYNQNSLSELSSKTQLYETALDTSLKTFEAGVELKKLSGQVYQTRLQGDIGVYNTKSNNAQILKDLLLKQFQGNTDVIIKKLGVNMEGYNTIVHALESIAQGRFQAASAALQTLGVMISQAA